MLKLKEAPAKVEQEYSYMMQVYDDTQSRTIPYSTADAMSMCIGDGTTTNYI